MFPIGIWRLGLAMVVLSIGLGVVELVLRVIGFNADQQSMGSTIALVGVITVWPWRGVRVVRWVLDRKKLVDDASGIERVKTAFESVRAGAVSGVEFVIFESDANKAITLGTKSDSIVAISTGTLRSFNDEELKALLAHEQGHLEGGHSIQSYAVLSALFLAKVLFGGFGLPITMFLLGLYLYLLRTNELEADAFAAQKVGAESMSSFLRKLEDLTNAGKWSETMVAELVSTHPRFSVRRRSLLKLVPQKS
jgi:Zn-dependent protease with chaperone function